MGETNKRKSAGVRLFVKPSNTCTNKDGPDAGFLFDWGLFVVTQLV